MASYARARAIPTLWYRVDETDNDVATLTNAGEDESAVALYERAIDAGLSPEEVHRRSMRLVRPS